MLKKRQQKKTAQTSGDADALFLGDGVRAITRKTMLPGFTIADLEQFLTFLYGMFEEKEAKQIRVFDPFAQIKGRRVTVARLAEAIEQVIEHNMQKSA